MLEQSSTHLACEGKVGEEEGRRRTSQNSHEPLGALGGYDGLVSLGNVPSSRVPWKTLLRNLQVVAGRVSSGASERTKGREGRRRDGPAAVVDAEGELARDGDAGVDHRLVELVAPLSARLRAARAKRQRPRSPERPQQQKGLERSTHLEYLLPDAPQVGLGEGEVPVRVVGDAIEAVCRRDVRAMR